MNEQTKRTIEKLNEIEKAIKELNIRYLNNDITGIEFNSQIARYSELRKMLEYILIGE